MPFQGLGLDAKILQAVKDAGYTEPTPIQVASIPPIVAGHDLIGIAQTGTGKTAAFTLPLLTRLAAQPPAQRRATRVLILAPTRELVVQIEENVRAYSRHSPLTVATVFGGVGEHPQIRALRAGTDIIIACPGRLLDLMRRRCADFSQLKALVLDEADRMLDMGFLPDIRSIVQQLPKQRQTLMFSATLSKEIERLTHDFQHAPKMVQIGRRSNPAETVTQLVYEVPKHLKTSLLLHLLRDPQMNMVLVFSRMKHAADRLARQLEQSGVRTATLHSNRSQNQRLRALKDFKSGAVRVLVATDIAARGIDVDGISHVVNYDFPMHVEDYVHRIGRTGRANAIGDAISFISPEDHGELRAVERFIGRGIVRKRAEGFNYSGAVPARHQAGEVDRGSRHQHGAPKHQGHRGQGGHRHASGQQRRMGEHEQRAQHRGQHAQSGQQQHDRPMLHGQQSQQVHRNQHGQKGQQVQQGHPRRSGHSGHQHGGGTHRNRHSGQRRWGR